MTEGSAFACRLRRAVNVRPLAFRVGVAMAVLMGLPSPGAAQSQGVVTADRAIIWRADVSVVAAVVDRGTVLELTARSERWYEVVIPQKLGGRGDRGLISVNQVRLAGGSVEPPRRALRGSPTAEEAPVPAPASRPATPLQEPPVGLRGFGQAGIVNFSASQSFAAIIGESFGPTFGVGVQVRFRPGLYVQASAERFRQTGERVYIFGGETFPLGIPNTITVQPIIVSAGYRPPRGVLRPYLGAGVGSYSLKETSPFDDSSERRSGRYTGYHAHGGVEFRAHPWLVPAVEARFTTVPDALGRGGASAEFAERNLGGWQIHAKILMGR